MDLEILYEDKDLMVCKKAPGVPAQSDKTFDVDMVSAILARQQQKGEELYCAPINRLDKPVGGIMLFAKNKKAAGLLSDSSYTKEYQAVVYGFFNEKEGVFEDYLVRDGKTNTSMVVGKNNKLGKKAELKYKVLKEMTMEGENLSLVEIELLTGRHHQIRVQFSSRNHPLYGDRKYGNKSTFERKDMVALCATKLTFNHPILMKKMTFSIEADNGIFARIPE